MLTWGAPGALWLGLLLAPILVFYFLRMRFRRQPVSSLYLWARLQHVTRGASHLRWRSILLLAAQIVAAASAVLAAAQPALVSRRLSMPGTVFLLDASASMGATDGGESRFETARKLIAREIERLPAGAPGMIFLCGAGVEPLAGPTRDRGQLLARLAKARRGSAAFAEAEVAEAVQAWLAARQEPWQGCLVTDGGLDLGGERLTAVFANALRVLTVGVHGHNLGVTGLRFLPDGVAQFHVVNGWPSSRTVSVSIAHNDLEIARARVLCPPGASKHTLEAGAGRPATGGYTVRLHQPPDILAADDRAYLAVNEPLRLRVLLVGSYNPFLRAALAQAGVALTETPRWPSPDFRGAGWDLIVADRVPVPAGLTCHLLCFGDVPPDIPVSPGREVSGTFVGVDSGHPLLRFVDWGTVNVAGGRALRLGAGALALATVEGLPILAAWEREGWRGVSCGTTLFASDLGLSTAFPVFLRNYLQWCFPQVYNPLAYTLTVGRPAVLAAGPGWRVRDLALRTERSGALVNARALAEGIYPWQDGERRGVLAANPPFSELDLAPRTLRSREPAAKVAAEYGLHRMPLTQWLLIVLVAALCLEWVMWRGGLPFRRGVGDHVVD